MKAISVRQPWAWLIVNGYKTAENRAWKTGYRGRLLIHAAKTLDLTAEDLENMRQDMHQVGIDMPSVFDLGGIVGAVDLVDCTLDPRDDDADWHERGFYAFILRNPTPMPFRLLPGRLSLFSVNDE